MPDTSLPERTILTLLRNGVAAIDGDVDLLDDVLADLEPDDLTRAKATWTQHPPTVRLGYPVGDTPLPCWALVLSSDTPAQDYLGVGEHVDLMGDPPAMRSHQRVKGAFGIYVYAESPDVAAWYYRVARRVCNVGIRWLVSQGLQEPTLQGQELVPDPRYQPTLVFVRRLTLTVEYEEAWRDDDALWQAVNGAPPVRLSGDGTLDVVHEDSEGGVSPYTPGSG